MLPVPGYAEEQAFGYVDVFDYKLTDGWEKLLILQTDWFKTFRVPHYAFFSCSVLQNIRH